MEDKIIWNYYSFVIYNQCVQLKIIIYEKNIRLYDL